MASYAQAESKWREELRKFEEALLANHPQIRSFNEYENAARIKRSNDLWVEMVKPARDKASILFRKAKAAGVSDAEARRTSQTDDLDMYDDSGELKSSKKESVSKPAEFPPFSVNIARPEDPYAASFSGPSKTSSDITSPDFVGVSGKSNPFYKPDSSAPMPTGIGPRHPSAVGAGFAEPPSGAGFTDIVKTGNLGAGFVEPPQGAIDPSLFSRKAQYSPPAAWGVGAAQGMPFMHRYDTGGPERWLAEQKAKQSFEDFLGQSGMSDEEKAQARISYFNPRLGDIIARSRQNREDAADRLMRQKMMEQARQDAFKASQEAKTQHEKEVAEAKKAQAEAAAAGLIDAAPTGAVPRWAAPEAPMTPETAAFPQTVAGLIGGMTGYTPPAGQVGQSPGVASVMQRQGGSIVSRLGPATKTWIELNAPNSTFGKSLMAEGEFKQIKMKQIEDQAKQAETLRKEKEQKQQKIQAALDTHKKTYLGEFETLKKTVSSPQEAMEAVQAVMNGMRPGTVAGIIERRKKEAAAAKTESVKKETENLKAADLAIAYNIELQKAAAARLQATVQKASQFVGSRSSVKPFDRSKIDELKAKLKARGIPVPEGDTPIKDPEKVVKPGNLPKPDYSGSSEERHKELVNKVDSDTATPEEIDELKKIEGIE